MDNIEKELQFVVTNDGGVQEVTLESSDKWIPGIDYPEWMVYRSLETLKGGYLIGNETPKDAIQRIANRVAELIPKKAYEGNLKERVFEVLWNQEVSPSSPVWSNFGTPRGLPISCFGSYIPDSISGIYDGLSENAKMSQLGGGTSSYWGDVRHRGSQIANQSGTTGGPFEFLSNYDGMISKVSQGGCYKEGTKVLTDKGFKDFRDVNPKKDLIAQLDDLNKITFTKEYELTVRDWNGELINIQGAKKKDLVNISVTPNHRMVIERLDGKKNWKGYTEIISAEDLKLHRDNRMFLSGELEEEGEGLSWEDKLRIAFQADGRKDSKTRKMGFHLSKSRKITRLKSILEGLNLSYVETKTSQGTTRFSIENAEDYKENTLDWINLKNLTKTWVKEFITEISLWDGSDKKNRSSIVYTSVVKSNVEKVQAIVSLGNKRSRVTTYSNRKGNRQDLYSITISEKSQIQGDSCSIKKVDYVGKVYCAIVPKGRLLVSNGGRTLVCGNTRRGSHASYIDFSHPDVEEILEIKKVGCSIQNLFTGIAISKEDRENIYAGDERALKIWSKVLSSRNQTGMPYLLFKDNVNDGTTTPPWYGLNKTQIKASNLCSEIMLPSNEDESFVCCLLSMNAITYDKWKNTDAVNVANIILEAILEDFIIKTTGINEMQRARRFALRHRSVGLGLLGIHTYLQSKHQPFVGMYSTAINKQIMQTMKTKSRESSKNLAKILGNAPIVSEYNSKYNTNHSARHSTLLAIAPTVSNSTISGGVSPGIEPLSSNYFSQKSAKGNFTVINNYLLEMLSTKYPLYNTKTTLDSIRDNSGSVQHLDWMSLDDKEVFKTFSEINQFEMVRLASVRQSYIDQGQSLNVHIAPDTDPKLVSALYLMGAELGVKSFYYQRSTNILRNKNGVALDSMDASACVACEG